jgi:hypothetical protein
MTFDDAQTAPTRDNVTFARFYVKAVENPFEGNKQGRPIYDEKEYVEIIIAGQKSTVDRKVTADDKVRFAPAYAAFLTNREAVTTGTPLEEWPALSVSQIAEFRSLNIRTLEALASLDDAAIQRLGTGGRKICERAKARLEEADGGAPLDRALAALDSAAQDRVVDAKTIRDQAAEIERLKALVSEGGQ